MDVWAGWRQWGMVVTSSWRCEGEEGEGRGWMDWRFKADWDNAGQLWTHCPALMGNIASAVWHFDPILIADSNLIVFIQGDKVIAPFSPAKLKSFVFYVFIEAWTEYLFIYRDNNENDHYSFELKKNWFLVASSIYFTCLQQIWMLVVIYWVAQKFYSSCHIKTIFSIKKIR